jgi:Subtilase family
MSVLTTIEISTSSIAGDVLSPDANGQQEYVITLKNHSDLDGFYNDLETPGGSITIPDRAVGVVQRLPTSRNTTYMLTAKEAEQIRQDPRVLSVDLTLEQKGQYPVRHWSETSSYWSKSGLNSQYLNWALLRTSLGREIAGWGSDRNPETTATVALAASGKNVDVVIVDDLINPSHPEIARNPDGTGGSRFVPYNWGQWNSTVLGQGIPNIPYTYNTGTDYQDHGAHVTGIAAGNTCGWARDANVYNINPYGTSGNQINPNPYTVLEYVKQFHINKPVNPATGRPNPTVVNISWGISPKFLVTGSTPQSFGKITRMRYRGVTYDTTTWGAEDFAYPQREIPALTGTGLFVAQANFQWGIYFPVRNAAVEATIQDLIDVGCIVCGASGNEYNYVMNPSTDNADHYNDYLEYRDGIRYYPKQGNISATPDCISVGNASSKAIPGKSQSSNTGPRIDIWAPGENIVSAANTGTNNVADPRNSSYYKTQLTGTSMATPQVTGVLACLLETYPDLTQAQAKQFLNNKFSTYNQIQDTGNAELYLGTFTSLDGAANRYLYFYPEKSLTGEIYPKENTDPRPTTGLLWPRPRAKSD